LRGSDIPRRFKRRIGCGAAPPESEFVVCRARVMLRLAGRGNAPNRPHDPRIVCYLAGFGSDAAAPIRSFDEFDLDAAQSGRRLFAAAPAEAAGQAVHRHHFAERAARKASPGHVHEIEPRRGSKRWADHHQDLISSRTASSARSWVSSSPGFKDPGQPRYWICGNG
jgi:hypothetical protein